ncbi:MAG: hypothetical protein KDC85_12930 [Saprospiraceae bacterium]|nr:hypothetical protein [Saprospiraceae bacterium]MCB9323997.1 hypothetical protein [Lewinellaceae bacterium]
MASKQKKISFSLFLNETLTPKKGGFYPVYLRITFKRQNTKIPDVLLNDHTLYWRKEDFEKFQKGDYSGSYRGEAQMVKESIEFYENIIRFEDAQDPENYSVSGLAERARFYRQNFSESLKKQIQYLFNLEAKSIKREGIEIKPLNFFTLEGNIGKVENHLSESLKRLIETYSLVTVYLLFAHNFNEDDEFSGTLYHWTIKNGVKNFSFFLDDYFGSRKKIDDSLLKNYFTERSSELKTIGKSLSVMPPDKNHKQLYLSVLSNHLEFILDRR